MTLKSGCTGCQAKLDRMRKVADLTKHGWRDPGLHPCAVPITNAPDWPAPSYRVSVVYSTEPPHPHAERSYTLIPATDSSMVLFIDIYTVSTYRSYLQLCYN